LAEDARERRRFLSASAAVTLFVAALAGSAAAQPPRQSPSWSELRPGERQVLAPLERDWDRLDSQRKSKWRGIAERYPSMAPQDQQRIRDQMQRWSQLTPEQRRAAREQYKSLRRLPPDKKEDVRQKWEQYQSLPPETRRELASRPPPGRGIRPAPLPVPPPSAPPPPK
jgi:hypothetical protein